MRRLLMTADAVGGVWRYSLDLGRALRARGFHTTLAVMGPPPDSQQRLDAADAGVDLVDRAFRLEWMDDPWHDVDRAGAWLLDLESQLQPSIVHLNGYVHGALPWRAPAMVVAHSCVRSWWRATKGECAPPAFSRYTSAVRNGLAAARAIVAPTTAMARAVRDEYDVPATIRTVPNGCTFAASQGEPPPDKEGKEAIVLTAGRTWDEAKNIAALSEIATAIDWPIYVAGESRSPDGSAVSWCGMRVLGHLPAGDMAAWYRRAAIYALPARYEPFGLSVLEAAAAGCALVLGDIPSLRENWNEAAIFVDPEDREALHSTLQRLIADRQLRNHLARRARARASRFTLDHTADQYARLYQTLHA